jgi:nucleotide-binding universal stress UspA family protein
MFNNILVAYDGSPSSRAAAEQALELAKGNNAHVTVLSVAPSVAPLAGLSGVSIDELGTELKQWAEENAREGAALAPADLNVHTVTRSGHIGEEIVAEIEAGGYDLVVLGSRGRGRLASELFGSANAYVHFHSRVPLLSISGDESNSDVVGEHALTSTAAR